MKRNSAWTVLLLVVFAALWVGGSMLPGQAVEEGNVQMNPATLSTFIFTSPKLGEKWPIGTSQMIAFKQINITTTGIWVRLVKNGQVVGVISHLTPLSGPATSVHSFSFTCASPLLDGATFGTGVNCYQIEVSAENNSKRRRSPKFSIVPLPVL